MQDLFTAVLDTIKITLRVILKTVTGFVIIPLGIAIDQLKPAWEEASGSVKFFTGVILLPATAFLYVAAPWWNDFDIAD